MFSGDKLMKNREKSTAAIAIALLAVATVCLAVDTSRFDRAVEAAEKAREKTGFGGFLNRLASERGLIFVPYVDIGYEYTDNLFLSSSAGPVRSASGLISSAGLRSTYEMGDHKIGVEYQADLIVYPEFSEQSRLDHDLKLYWELMLTDRVLLRAVDRFEREASTAGAPGGSMIEFFENTIDVSAAYLGNDHSWLVGVDIQNFMRNFTSGGLSALTYNENRLTAIAIQKISPSAQLHGRAIGGVLTYSGGPSRTITYMEVPIGLRGMLRSGFYISADLGVHIRNISAATSGSFAMFVADIDVSKRFNGDRTSVGVRVTKQPVEVTSFASTTVDELRFRASAMHYITKQWRVALSGYFASRDGIDEFSVVAGAPAQEDDRIGLSAGVSYLPKDWLRLSARYERRSRSMNFSVFDYDENSVSAGASIIF